MLPLAERHLPAAAADLRVAAGYQGGNGPTAEARALLNKMNPRLDQLDADLEARADAEADSVTKDVRRMHLIVYLLQSNRSKAARGHLPKINDPELRSALETLTAYKSGEEQLDAGAGLDQEVANGLFALSSAWRRRRSPPRVRRSGPRGVWIRSAARTPSSAHP